MSIYFVGDVANTDTYCDRHHHNKFEGASVVANLEGSIVNDDFRHNNDKIVFNTKQCIDSFFPNSKVVFNLANNHISDVSSPRESIQYLKSKQFGYLGAGDNVAEASKEYLIDDDNGKTAVLLAFGWNIIECVNATEGSSGSAPLNYNFVIRRCREVVQAYPKLPVIVLFHWCYELETIPLPLHRKLAQQLILEGVEAIIGCHPHCVQSVELFNDKPIVYSLGNWFFKEGFFFNNKLIFPGYCSRQLLFEFSFEGDHKCHLYEKRTKTGDYFYVDSVAISGFNNKFGYPELSELSIDGYDKFFKENRSKSFFLPIYKANDSQLSIKVKDYFNFVRTKLINALVYLGVK
jgi:poly-gamma-glutamate synthesis protein (capsule biosynthesis protein)